MADAQARQAPLGLIWAQSRNGIIGRDGTMPWHIPEDLAHFRRTTADHPVIMGRRTWNSLPPRFRPLPGRRNIVLTRQRDWTAPGVQTAQGLAQALELAGPTEPAWIIGGARVFAQALPLATHLVVTRIDADFDGDTPAPQIPPGWTLTAQEQVRTQGGLDLVFETWRPPA